MNYTLLNVEYGYIGHDVTLDPCATVSLLIR